MPLRSGPQPWANNALSTHSRKPTPNMINIKMTRRRHSPSLLSSDIPPLSDKGCPFGLTAHPAHTAYRRTDVGPTWGSYSGTTQPVPQSDDRSRFLSRIIGSIRRPRFRLIQLRPRNRPFRILQSGALNDLPTGCSSRRRRTPDMSSPKGDSVEQTCLGPCLDPLHDVSCPLEQMKSSGGASSTCTCTPTHPDPSSDRSSRLAHALCESAVDPPSSFAGPTPMSFVYNLR